MKKAVAILGSPRKEKSITYQITNQLLETVSSKYEDFKYQIFNLSDYDINQCLGCNSCFNRCSSCNQFDDDIIFLENKILEADLVVLGSPVYAHSITGQMKTFIDRTSYWLHVLRLVGKAGITISVSNSNGNMLVNDYLSKMMEFLGVSILENIDYSKTKGISINSFEACADKIINYFDGEIGILNLELKNKVFRVYKDAYLKIYHDSLKKNGICISQEAVFWKENNYFECENFEELYKMKQN